MNCDDDDLDDGDGYDDDLDDLDDDLACYRADGYDDDGDGYNFADPDGRSALRAAPPTEADRAVARRVLMAWPTSSYVSWWVVESRVREPPAWSGDVRDQRMLAAAREGARLGRLYGAALRGAGL